MNGARPINHVLAMRFPTSYRSFKSLLIIKGKENRKRREENEEWPSHISEEVIPYDLVLKNHFETYKWFSQPLAILEL